MMHLVTCREPDAAAKEMLLALWNAEYAAQLLLHTVQELEQYLEKLAKKQHWLLIDEHGHIGGWLMVFEREHETWFAVLLERALQGKGYGRQLLDQARAAAPVLHGWVVDQEIYTRADGTAYPVPMDFYLKMGFTVMEDVRLEDKISAVKIRWSRT